MNEPVASAQAIAATLAALDHVFALVRQVAVSRADPAALRSGRVRVARGAGRGPSRRSRCSSCRSSCCAIACRCRYARGPSPRAAMHRRAAPARRAGARGRGSAGAVVADRAVRGVVPGHEQPAHRHGPQIAGCACARCRSCRRRAWPADEIAVDRSVGEQIALACAEAERVSAYASTRGRWPWAEGRALAWRLERCMAASVSVTARTLELCPAAVVAVAARAVCARFTSAQCWRACRSARSRSARRRTRRSRSRVCGLRARDGAVRRRRARGVRRAVRGGRGARAADPHRLAHERTDAARCARTGALDRARAAAARRVRARAPALSGRLPVRLSRSICRRGWRARSATRCMPASAARCSGCSASSRSAATCSRMVGSALVVASGERGDPLRPRVLVGGEVDQPATPVVLYSPLGMTPWAQVIGSARTLGTRARLATLRPWPAHKSLFRVALDAGQPSARTQEGRRRRPLGAARVRARFCRSELVRAQPCDLRAVAARSRSSSRTASSASAPASAA